MMLTKRFVESEIKAAVFAMHPDKSPGPDGMNAGFFRRPRTLSGKRSLKLALMC